MSHLSQAVNVRSVRYDFGVFGVLEGQGVMMTTGNRVPWLLKNGLRLGFSKELSLQTRL